jgi:hypothetical protein
MVSIQHFARNHGVSTMGVELSFQDLANRIYLVHAVLISDTIVVLYNLSKLQQFNHSEVRAPLCSLVLDMQRDEFSHGSVSSALASSEFWRQQMQFSIRIRIHIRTH